MKDLIKNFSGSRYDNESKAWIVPLSRKNEFCQVVAGKCVQEGITILDVPKFVTTILESKIPFERSTKNKRIFEYDTET